MPNYDAAGRFRALTLTTTMLALLAAITAAGRPALASVAAPPAVVRAI